MAINTDNARSTTAAGRTPAALHVALSIGYVVGLVSVYVAQRVWVAGAGAATALSAVGVAACLVATAVRFAPLSGAPGRASVARLLGAIQGLGLLGLAGYFLLLKAEVNPDATHLRDAMQVAWVAALAVSLASLGFAEGALEPMRSSTHVEVRRVQAAASSGLVLGLAAVYGSLFVYGAAKQEAQADFSYFRTASPGESTLKIVEQLSEPIRVTGFFPDVSEVRKEVQTYLTRLGQKNSKLEIKLVDRYAEPKLAKELKVTSDGTLVLSRGETQQTLSVGVDLAKARPKLIALDKDFNSRLVKLLRSRRAAYLTTGHGELTDSERGDSTVAEGRTGSIFKQLLEQQNYRTKDLGVAQGLGSQVPDDADVVFVLGPTQPFSDEEIGALGRYAEGGGKLFLALDPEVNDDGRATGKAAGLPTEVENPRSIDWLVKLGRAVGADYVPTLLADEERFLARRNSASDHIIMPTNRFSSHASVSTLSRNSARSGVVVAGSGYLKKQDGGPFQSEVTVRTFASAFADDNGDFKLTSGESKNVYNLGIALTRQKGGSATDKDPSKKDAKNDLLKADPKAEGEMRAFVFADADVFSDLLMGRVSGNQLLAFDAVRWLTGEESVAGEIESEEDVRLEPTKQKDLVWFYTTIFGVPVLVLGCGLVLSRSLNSKRRSSKRSSAERGVNANRGSKPGDSAGGKS